MIPEVYDYGCFLWLLLLEVACTKVQVLETVGLGDLHIMIQTLLPGEDLISKEASKKTH